jgi:high-affinity Fe2+/Pb2+ permease
MTYGPLIVSLFAALGTLVSIFNYLSPDSGIAGTPGAILVIVSTLILVGFGLIMRAGAHLRPPLRIFVMASALLDIAGTSFAGYLLNSQTLVSLMAACFMGWLMHLFAPRTASA